MKTTVLYLYDKAGNILFASRELLYIRNEINRLNLLSYKEYLSLKKYGYIWLGNKVIFDNCEIIKREYQD